MLSRLAARSLHLRLLALSLTSPRIQLPFNTPPPPPPTTTTIYSPSNCTYHFQSSRSFSTWRSGDGGGEDGGGTWKLTPDPEEGDSVFGDEHGELSGITDDPFNSAEPASVKTADKSVIGKKGKIFDGIAEEFESKTKEVNEDWETAEGYKPWTLGEDEEKADVFDIGNEGGEGIEGMEGGDFDEMEKERIEEQQKLERKEQELAGVLKGELYLQFLLQITYL